MRTLRLFTTQGCHLCEVAAEMLEREMAVITNMNHEKPEVEEIEISDADDLMEAYAIRIPVLKFTDSKTELAWPFSAQELNHFLLEELSTL